MWIVRNRHGLVAKELVCPATLVQCPVGHFSESVLFCLDCSVHWVDVGMLLVQCIPMIRTINHLSLNCPATV